MEIQDLVSVGRLGTVIDKEDFVSFRKNDHFQPAFFQDNPDVFLIFDKCIVFYVTIDRIRIEGKKTFLHFAEDGVIESVRNAGTTEVSYPDDMYRKIYVTDADIYDPIDMKAVFENQVIGTIEDYLENLGQRVLVIISNEGKEILVPEVDAFIENVDYEKRIIYFKDIQELIDL
jgi:ribosomal 30S subunit maturation factor RimM